MHLLHGLINTPLIILMCVTKYTFALKRRFSKTYNSLTLRNVLNLNLSTILTIISIAPCKRHTVKKPPICWLELSIPISYCYMAIMFIHCCLPSSCVPTLMIRCSECYDSHLLAIVSEDLHSAYVNNKRSLIIISTM